MTGTLVHPNLHAALIHIPLALTVVGVVLELLTLVFWNLRKSTLRSAGRWMLVLGILSAVPVLTTGLYALRQTAGVGSAEGEAWEAIAARSNWSPEQWAVVREHVKWMTIGTLMLLLGIVIWISATDNARRNMYLLGIAVLIAGGGMMVYGGHAGGELVYKYGVGVSRPEIATANGAAAAAEVAEAQVSYSPLEMHVFFAGAAIALIAAALGLSVRLSNVLWENRFAEEKAVAAGHRPAGRMGQSGNLLSIPVIYPGVFWVLAILALSATVVMALNTLGMWKPQDVLAYLQAKQSRDEIRPVVHAWLGAGIIVLSIVLAVLIKFSPRRRLLTGISATLLAVLVVGQVWTGVLMLFDGTESPHFRFSRVKANTGVDVGLPIKVPQPAPATRPQEQLPANVPAAVPATPAMPAATAPVTQQP